MKKDLTKALRTRLDSGAWEELLSLWESSNLTVKEFCAEVGVSPAAFYQRRKRLEVEGKHLFSQIEIVSGSSGGETEVRLPGGIVICFAGLPPVDYLRKLSMEFMGVVL